MNNNPFGQVKNANLRIRGPLVDAALFIDEEFNNVAVPIGYNEYFFVISHRTKSEVVRIKVCADITQSTNTNLDFSDMEDTDPFEDLFRNPGALGPEIVVGVGRPTIFLPIRAEMNQRGEFYNLQGLILEKDWLGRLDGEEKSYKGIGKFEIQDQAECEKFLFSQRIPQPNASGAFESSLLFKQNIIDIK